MSRNVNDALGVLRGLQMVAEAAFREQRDLSKHLWSNSSVRELLESNVNAGTEYLNRIKQNPSEEVQNIQAILKETQGRGCVLAEGLRQLALIQFETKFKQQQSQQQQQQQHSHPQYAGDVSQLLHTVTISNEEISPSDSKKFGSSAASAGSGSVGGRKANVIVNTHTDAANLDLSTITLKELEEILSKRNKNREISLRTAATESKRITDLEEELHRKPTPSPIPKYKVEKIVKMAEEKETQKADAAYLEDVMRMVTGASSNNASLSGEAQESVKKAVTDPEDINLPELSKVAKQRKVPSSRLGRMASFGQLFAGLGLGTMSELTKTALGFGDAKNMKEALWSPANTERIVDTLCKVRGAALKIGQILSIQDTSVVSPELAKAFERVRQAADYMPDWQVERVMNTQLGPSWREMLQSFEQKPFAAASIGQVHRGVLKDGTHVAIKIQYPGVAKSIESDIDNLVGMLKVWDVFPRGFFIDNLVKVAKRELNWEVDYHREADYTEKFKEMVSPYPEYYVPTVYRDLTTSSVLTTELVPGLPLDKCFEMSCEHRLNIAQTMLKLCLRELFELQCMQTDPNWSNFLYDAKSKRLMLIDFGSTRFFQKKFIKNYREVIMCAANDNRQGVLEMSREMGFLTGYESKQMEDAHVDAVMILGEMFRYDGEFDFGKQNTTERIAHLVPTMVAHRLIPPPEEIYSIHRKLSGIFLLCARLKVKMNCRVLYDEIIVGKFEG